jgi:hypothetical protein
VCPCVSVLCCPVLVEALHRADPPAKESYQMSLCRSRKPIRVGQRSAKDCKYLLKKNSPSTDLITPMLQRLEIFQVSNLISFFNCLGHSKESVQV